MKDDEAKLNINNSTNRLTDHNLLEEEENHLDEYKLIFELFDKDGSGSISKEELGMMMSSMGSEYTETQLEDMINDIAHNGNKEISFQQFMVLMNKRSKEVDLVEEYTEAFKVFDREGTGTIRRDELKLILTTLGEGLKPEEVEYMLRDADIDRNGFIEYKSFVRLMLFK